MTKIIKVLFFRRLIKAIVGALGSSISSLWDFLWRKPRERLENKWLAFREFSSNTLLGRAISAVKVKRPRLAAFCSNSILGILVALFLLVIHDSSWVREPENWAMDAMMNVSKALPSMAESTSSGKQEKVEYSFLEIDEATYRKWGEPYHVPRDRLQTLIDFSATGGAKIIIVDVALSKDGLVPEHDANLIEFLRQYDEGENPPLILARTFQATISNDNTPLPNIEQSFIDKYGFKNNVFWAAPLFKVDLSDGILRRWELLRLACQGGKPVVVPSIQLLVDALLRMKESEKRQKRKKLTTQLTNIRPETCQQLDEQNEYGSTKLDYGGRPVDWPTDGLGERLIFTIPWKIEKGHSYPDFERFPALLITDNGSAISHDLVKDRVVVIGGSYSAGRDNRWTPIGYMPGALVVLNAVKSLHLFGQIRAPAGWVKLGLEIVLILLMALAFSSLGSMKGAIVVGLIIVIVLLPISFHYFKYGIWLELAVPILAMQIHQVIAEYEEGLHAKEKNRRLEEKIKKLEENSK